MAFIVGQFHSAPRQEAQSAGIQYYISVETLISALFTCVLRLSPSLSPPLGSFPLSMQSVPPKKNRIAVHLQALSTLTEILPSLLRQLILSTLDLRKDYQSCHYH